MTSLATAILRRAGWVHASAFTALDKISALVFSCCLLVLLHNLCVWLTTGLDGTAAAAVTYSLSLLSQIIAPIKTARLTCDRARDAEMMSRLLVHDDLAVCPEGTMCREPCLLRFSPVFAELANDMEPVALDAQVTTLHLPW
ncbi:glycerol-3-phosphate acyltransferase RAM2-like [Phragmites australis]|uniref:glycerol-3-phosphate acyltransferase RAM2-like n=1 Tax=Phragmites australis TaxID=29695 RepID=UPI002D76B4BE|nr:glycerol-3-phosphate acyltransferase RAM2-like [Phragmites australis]